MAESVLMPVSPWAGLLRPQVNPGSKIILQPLDNIRIASLALRPHRAEGFAGALEEKWGFTPPPKNRRAASAALALIATPPDAWLAISSTLDDFETVLLDSLGEYACITDQSDAKAVIRVSGPAAREVLAKILPIDLHPTEFGAGSAATTTAGQIGVTIWQLDARPSYEMAVARSYAGSFARWMVGSAAPAGLDIVAA